MTAPESPAATPPAALPRAVVAPRPRLSWMWVIPLLALLLAGGMVWRSWSMRGVGITIQFADGYGLKAGDSVRYRGIVVGDVRDVRLADDRATVFVRARLHESAASLAARGTRFWIVRPRVGPTGVEGLETVVGPRYLALAPAPAPAPGLRGPDEDEHALERRDFFIGLEEPPVIEMMQPGDLEILLEAPNRGGLQPGAVVLYRQHRVGTILSVGLASDGSAIECRVHVEQPYVNLIRERTRFWDSGGVNMHLGLRGLSVEFESLASLIIGGVSLATPPDAGDVVRTGHRFRLEQEMPREAANWKPGVPVGVELLPPGAVRPSLERAALQWTEGLLRRSRDRRGWVLALEDGLIGPLDLLQAPSSAREGTAMLTIAGAHMPLAPALDWSDSTAGLARRAMTTTILPAGAIFPRARLRRPAQPEDCLVLADSAAGIIPVAAGRLAPDGAAHWKVDEAITFLDDWHGAAVLSRVDGRVIGFLLVERGIGRVAIVPEALVPR